MICSYSFTRCARVTACSRKSMPQCLHMHASRSLRHGIPRAAQQESTVQKATAIFLTTGLAVSLALAPAAAAKSLQDRAAEQERAYQEQLRKMKLALEKWERAKKDKMAPDKPQSEASGIPVKG